MREPIVIKIITWKQCSRSVFKPPVSIERFHFILKKGKQFFLQLNFQYKIVMIRQQSKQIIDQLLVVEMHQFY